MKQKSQSGVALVITLLMLSVITFLTVAFLAITRRDRAAVSTAQDQRDSRNMSDAALARAQSEIIARMMSTTDYLNYDLMVSRNFINPYGFTNSAKFLDTNNVNYDFDWTKDGPVPATNRTYDLCASNIANLWFDPRPPVFVRTNASTNYPLDFRFFVDINRNGLFETNGVQPIMDTNSDNYNDKTGFVLSNNVVHVFLTNTLVGEPEWIGILKNPEYPHSETNQFIGRYAFLILPAGKTLDLNYIHNYAKTNGSNTSYLYKSMTNVDNHELFLRNEGAGSWEINAGAFFRDLNTNAWESTNVSASERWIDPANYRYETNWNPSVNNGTNTSHGIAITNAWELLIYRYNNAYTNLLDANAMLPGTNRFSSNWIDDYSSGPLLVTATNRPPDGDPTNRPWAGSDNPVAIMNPQELFDTDKFPSLGTNLLYAGTNQYSTNLPSTYNRFTFQRLLGSIGTDSDPELYVDIPTTNTGTYERHVKVNLNYDNTYQITNFNFQTNNQVFAQTNFRTWDVINSNFYGPLAFFTNAADLILRSEFKCDTNYTISNLLVYENICVTNHQTNSVTKLETNTYLSMETSNLYNQRIHRCLQLAANLFETMSNNPAGFTQPTIFQPIFTNRLITNFTYGGKKFLCSNLYIISYKIYNGGASNVVTDTNSGKGIMTKLREPFGTNIASGDLVWGVPLVIGARKGLPNFNELDITNQVWITRKLLFWKRGFSTNIAFTNQTYYFAFTNSITPELWNSYSTTFNRPVCIMMSNWVYLSFTNELGYGTNMVASNSVRSYYDTNQWTRFIEGQTASDIILPFPQPTNNYTNWHQYLENDHCFRTNEGLSGTVETNIHGFPIHQWYVHVTNRLVYFLFDTTDSTKWRLLDSVNFETNWFSGTTNIFTSNSTELCYPWITNSVNPSRPTDNTTNSPMSAGISNQIYVSRSAGLVYPGWVDTNKYDEATEFNGWFNTTNTNTINVYETHEAPYPSLIVFSNIAIFEANDPLVHYTLDDMKTQGGSSGTIGIINRQYGPWGYNAGAYAGGSPLVSDYYLKDPQITKSDDWDFLTNKFPNVGWIGRVHRGTPWQTVFLKSDSEHSKQWGNWTSLDKWGQPGETYPTNDWRLLDLFTTAPNENAARGTLSVNQTNLAAWSAVLDGVIALSDRYTPAVIQPDDVSKMFYGYYNTDAKAWVPGIMSTNTNSLANPDGSHRILHSSGEIFAAPTLTVSNVFLKATWANDANINDSVVERIPQQIGSLLRVGYPRFVIYAYGQSLKPLDLYDGADHTGMCTNYQITGECLTRTVCHLEGMTNNGGNPNLINFTNGLRIVVDGFSVVPGE